MIVWVVLSFMRKCMTEIIVKNRLRVARIIYRVR